ncbi:MAG: hypothetical protein OHK0039_18190 [Bacteroidia bacterium]
MLNRYFRQAYVLAGLVVFIWASCKPVIDIPQTTLGHIDARHYYALGDGYSAGFGNGDWSAASTKGLYEAAQATAFPVLLSQQLADIAPVAFNQHLAPAHGSGYRSLASIERPFCHFLDVHPVFQTHVAGTSWERAPLPEDTIHNLAIPHLRLAYVDEDSFGRSSPFFRRMAANRETKYIELLDKPRISFFTLWLGTEDVLDHAMNGGSPTTGLLSAGQFAHKYSLLLERIGRQAQPQLRGVVGTIPDVTRFPYFAQIAPFFINIENCTGTQLPVYIQTRSGDVRIALPQDRLLLPVKDEIGSENGLPGRLGFHPENPLPGQRILDQDEVALLRTHIHTYNHIIDSLVQVFNQSYDTPRLLVCDLYALFEGVAANSTYDGLLLTNTYLEGGVFGLDGVYLTPRGQALVANTFLETINQAKDFKARIPKLQLALYPGVAYP